MATSRSTSAAVGTHDIGSAPRGFAIGSATGSPASRLADSPAAITADIAVVGAGPAGLAAAVTAAGAGNTVVLLDAEPAVGGQFWRHPAPGDDPERVRDAEIAPLHHRLGTYRRLRRSLMRSVADGAAIYLPGHDVWAIERGVCAAGGGASAREAPVDAAHGGAAAGADAYSAVSAGFVVSAVTGPPGARAEVRISAHRIILAPGAFDLQVPFPGWDLPGVLAVGGVQSLLKGHNVLAGGRVVVAGTGPFLLSVAAGLLRSGARVTVVVEAASPLAWLRRLPALVAAGSRIVEAARYAATLARHRTAYRTGWSVLRAEGDGALESVVIAPLAADGSPIVNRAKRVDTDVLAVGWGFVPQLELPLMLGCATETGANGLPVISTDARQRTSVPGVYVAGEACGVGGAELALVEGELAGTAAAADTRAEFAAESLAHEVLTGRMLHLVRRRAALRAFADAIAAAYPAPSGWAARLPDETVVCRCEEVRAGEIRAAALRDGAGDARSAKLLTRAGMGHCQGRICGFGVECVTAAAAGGVPRHRAQERPVAAPLPLGLLAADSFPLGLLAADSFPLGQFAADPPV